MKILYLQSTSEIGGSDIALLRILEKLDRSRFEPTVLLPNDGPLVAAFRRLGCEVFLLPGMLPLTTRRGPLYLARYLFNYPLAVWRIARLIRRQKVDLVHTNSLHNLYGFLAALLAKRPHVWHAREVVTRPALRALEAFLARRFAARLIVPSDAVGAMFQGGRARPANLRKVSDSIDTERFHPRNDGRLIRRERLVAPEAPLVGLVGRLDEVKGIETFLRAAALCRRSRPDARFLVVGGEVAGQKGYAERLERLAGSLGLRGAVDFTLWRYGPEEMPDVHGALNVLVSASRLPEAFGLVLLEAMATAKPVVATAHGGPSEVCVEEETALLVPPEDPRRMADAILALIGDPVRARSLGEAGRRRVLELYDQRACLKTLETIYAEV